MDSGARPGRLCLAPPCHLPRVPQPNLSPVQVEPSLLSAQRGVGGVGYVCAACLCQTLYALTELPLLSRRFFSEMHNSPRSEASENRPRLLHAHSPYLPLLSRDRPKLARVRKF